MARFKRQQELRQAEAAQVQAEMAKIPPLGAD